MNRLADSRSPYLRQHADNPVEWYPWGEEALARARAEDRPILLSVGYSACHWCHVMAHESFEDPAIAALMNRDFINIKVDREERPDVDAIYQKVVQLMGQGGGWPLTVFLLPDLRPFYGGTYFPPAPRYGRPGFPQVLQALAEAYRERRAELVTQAERFLEGFEELGAVTDEESAKAPRDQTIAGLDALADAGRRLLARIDPEWGGLGRQPKFPNVSALELLLVMSRAEAVGRRMSQGTGITATAALRLTLDKMARGGIYDHLRGGFARYSVDREWLVPHFEKMLYDNAQLIGLYADAAVLWPDLEGCRAVVEESVDYLVADMRGDHGTFYAATDADSEGVEGKYFVWTPAELEELLGADAARTFAAAYGVSAAGNFEHGASILHLPRPLAEVAAELGVGEAALRRELEAGREALLERRYDRVPPLRDDKILTAWNGLAISGLCRAAAAAELWGSPEQRAAWEALARAAARRLLDHHVLGDSSVLRVDFHGEAHTAGYLDDVAFLARACLDLYDLSLETEWVEAAAGLARRALSHYSRSGGDGFYLGASDGEALIERVESQHDAAIPSGLGVIVEVLLRLDHLGAAPAGARAAAEASLHRHRSALGQPFAFASLIAAAMWAAPEATQVTLRGPDPASVQALALTVRRARARVPAAIGLGFEAAEAVSAIVCRAQVCAAPVADPEALARAIAG
ncbi:MAG: thioredoxin domain-containing protein [Nannocystaceae bacterium]